MVKKTGEKLTALENLDSIQNFYKAIFSDEINEGEMLGFKLIYQALIQKSREAICPISNAAYSSIMIYEKDQKLLIHSGANIDPTKKELFKLKEYRNCAEKQAAISAGEIDKATNAELKMIFLYRKLDPMKIYPAEKLLPCLDCYAEYVEDLIKNNGKLIIVIDDNRSRDFFIPGTAFNNAIDSTNIDSTKINYKIFDAQALRFLRIEKELGGRVSKSFLNSTSPSF